MSLNCTFWGKWLSEEELAIVRNQDLKKDDLLAEAIRYTPIHHLYEKVMAKMNNNIEVFAVTDQSLLGAAKIYHDIEHSKIQISIRASVTKIIALQLLIQELANALVLNQCDILYKRASAGEIGQEDFAYQMEELEYFSTKKYVKIVEKLQAEYSGFWNLFSQGFDSFAKYLDYQKEKGHTQIYLETWKKLNPEVKKTFL